MLEPLFNKVAIRPATLFKTFEDTYFVEQLQTAATIIFQNYFPEYLKEAALHINIFQFCLF